MTTRKYLRSLFLAMMGVLQTCNVANAFVLDEDHPGKRPNIILIMADDLGYECVTCNGGESYQTPRLDAMAAEGLRFSQCHSQPVCTPTRVQIMTGRCNSRNYWAFGSLHPKELTFGHVLKAAGYATCITGKWQLSGRGQRYPGTHPDKSGFDEWCLWELDEETRGSRYWNPTIKANGKLLPNTEGKFGPDIFCDYLLDFISRNKTEPFFAYYPMTLTHGPTHPTPDTTGYDPSTKPKRDAKYFADMVNYTDKIVGRVLDHLDREGLAENTLVLFVGDNGTDKKLTSKFQGRVVRGGKGRKLDVSTHVPMIASWKGTLPAGEVCNDLIDFTDMMPTFVEMATAQVPDGLRFDGVSFFPQLRGQPGNPKPYIYCYYEKGKYDGESPDSSEGSPAETDMPVSEKKTAKQLRKSQPTRWVHDGRWKLLNSGSFFDLKNDPDEQSSIPDGEAGQEGESKRVLFQRVLDEKSSIQKEYGPVVIGADSLRTEEPDNEKAAAIHKKGGGFTPNKVIEFKPTNGRPLVLHVFFPEGHKKDDSRPAIVLFFGGGWKGGSPSQMYPQASYLASRGMVAISAQYRTYSRYKAEPFTCVEDGKSAIRYVRKHAKELGIDENKVAAGGASAGGHVAAATATVKAYDCPNDDLTISAVPDALVLFNPVYDNGPNGYGYERVKDYYKTISPIDNLDGTQPSTLVLMGSRDKHTPVATTELYDQRMETNGNRCDTIIYEGQKHGFFNLHKGNNSEYFIKTVDAMDQFLVSLGFLSGKPTVKTWLTMLERK